jgi:DNA-binding NarL/FixJ family response regulator
MTEQIKVVIVDDHPLFREGVAHIIASAPDLSVVAEGSTADEALALAAEHQPDILLLDLDLPGGGLSILARAAEVAPQTRVVVLTVSADEEHAIRAFRAGVRGYILKGVGSRELIDILRQIKAGQGYVPPSLGAVLISALTMPQPAPSRSPLDELTPREHQILLQIAAGHSNKEIGQQFSLTEKTVKYYVSNILLKLQARNRTEAAMIAQRLHGEG